MTTVFRDWKLQLQWDDSKIAQGLKRLDKLMSRTLQVRYNKIEKLQDKIHKKDVKRQSSAEKVERDKAKALAKEESRRKALAKQEERSLEAQKKYISNLDAIDRKLRRQQFAVSGRPGSSSVVSSINQQRQAVAAMKQSALDMGGNFKNTAMYSDQLKRLRENAALAGKQVHSLTKQLSIQEQATHSLGNSIRNLGRSYISIFAAIAGAGGMYKVGEDLQQIKAGLVMLPGGQAQVGASWEFITKVATTLGSNLNTTAKGYQQIMFAANDMGKSQEEARNIFMASQEAATAFNLSVDDATGVTRA